VARVPLLDESNDPPTQALIDTLKKGRRGNLLGIYKALLHNPKLAGTWFQHLNAVRWETTLSGRLREILIIRVGWRLNSAYIMKQHIPRLAEPEGLGAADCERLLKEDVGEAFSDAERAAIQAADELTIRARLSDGAASVLKVFYDDRAVVEIMVLIGTYNMHARFIAGLDIELEKD